jgi:hypothetical protein
VRLHFLLSGALIVAAVGVAHAQSVPSATPTSSVAASSVQQASGVKAPDMNWKVRDPELVRAIGTARSSDDVCFSTCKYQGDSKIYIGAADKDDDLCTNACGAAKKQCTDNDTNCKMIQDSCKYTNCN